MEYLWVVLLIVLFIGFLLPYYPRIRIYYRIIIIILSVIKKKIKFFFITNIHLPIIFIIETFLEKKYVVLKRTFLENSNFKTSYHFEIVNRIVQANVIVTFNLNDLFPRVLIYWDIFVSKVERKKRLDDFLLNFNKMSKGEVEFKLLTIPGLYYSIRNAEKEYEDYKENKDDEKDNK